MTVYAVNPEDLQAVLVATLLTQYRWRWRR